MRSTVESGVVTWSMAPGTANRVAYWTGPSTVADDDLFFDGTNGIGTTVPGVKPRSGGRNEG